MTKPNVVFDFDGVIHAYTSSWEGPAVIPDPPVPGIKEAIDEIRKAQYRVIVVSARCSSREGMEAIKEYLEIHGIEVDEIRYDKPPAKVYVDDRAIMFDGHTDGLLQRINDFRPWNGKLRG